MHLSAGEGEVSSGCRETPPGPRGAQAGRETGGQRESWVRVQGERTRAQSDWDHGDGEEGTGRVRTQGSGGADLRGMVAQITLGLDQ